MKIYTISGLGADKRVFKNLKIDAEIIHLDWITPEPNETIEHYAKRLSEPIDKSEEFCLMGVSFGGMIASEMSHFLQPKATILISSAETKMDLPWYFRFVGHIKLLLCIPTPMFHLPHFIASIIFQTTNKKLLFSILDETDPGFSKWASNAICSWKNTLKINNCYKIHGAKDRILLVSKNYNGTLITDGGHLMVLDKAKEVSAFINNILNKNS